MPLRLRLDRAAKVDELDRVRWRSWFAVRPSCAWLAEARMILSGKVAIELRVLVDVLRSCLDASEVVGDGCEMTGEAAV